MEPLSCKNCCHNPMQLGPIGTAFGYCTRHHLTLHVPYLTTCGQLLRKDLLPARAKSEREIHAQTYSRGRVSLVTQPTRSAADAGWVHQLNGEFADDQVFQTVANYGSLPSKFASIAALSVLATSRAEIAMVSLGRAYFRNCAEHDGQWTAGVHVLWWTLRRLYDEPTFGATDVLGPISLPLERLLELAQWQLVTFRLALIIDVSDVAREASDPVGGLAALAREAVATTQPGSPSRLLAWLRKRTQKISEALPMERYFQLREELRDEHPED